jgi:hypothetical protein
MANQLEPGTMGGSLPVGTTVNEAHGGAAHPSFHGRTVSWVAVSIIMIGFVVGGLAMIVGHHGPTWWMFWAGTALAVVGLLVSFATNTFEDWY